MKDNEETNILRNMPGRWVFVQIFCGSFANTTPQTYFYYQYNLTMNYQYLSILQIKTQYVIQGISYITCSCNILCKLISKSCFLMVILIKLPIQIMKLFQIDALRTSYFAFYNINFFVYRTLNANFCLHSKKRITFVCTCECKHIHENVCTHIQSKLMNTIFCPF